MHVSWSLALAAVEHMGEEEVAAYFECHKEKIPLDGLDWILPVSNRVEWCTFISSSKVVAWNVDESQDSHALPFTGKEDESLSVVEVAESSDHWDGVEGNQVDVGDEVEVVPRQSEKDWGKFIPKEWHNYQVESHGQLSEVASPCLPSESVIDGLVGDGDSEEGTDETPVREVEDAMIKEVPVEHEGCGKVHCHQPGETTSHADQVVFCKVVTFSELGTIIIIILPII